MGVVPAKKTVLVANSKNLKISETTPDLTTSTFFKMTKNTSFSKKNADRGRWFKFSGQGGRAIFTKIYLSFDSMISRGSRPYHRLRAESECILSSSDYFSEHFSFLQENPKNQKLRIFSAEVADGPELTIFNYS